jgi:WD40 repeat protein
MNLKQTNIVYQKIHIIFVTLLILCLLTSCVVNTDQETGNQASSVTVAESTKTDSVPAVTLTPTITPTLALPVAAGTPMPTPSTAITPENANLLQKLAIWGGGKINQVVYSSDGTSFAYAGSLGIHIYDARTSVERLFIATSSEVKTIAFSADGRLLASGQSENRIDIWLVSDGTLLTELTGDNFFEAQARQEYGITEHITTLAFSPDGKFLVSANDFSMVDVWQLSDWQKVKTLTEMRSRASSLEFTPNGAYLVGTSSINSCLFVWSTKDWSLTQQISLNPNLGKDDSDKTDVWSAALSPNGSSIAVGLMDGTIQIWGISDGVKKREFSSDSGRPFGLTYSPDGKTLAASAGSDVNLWDANTGNLIKKIGGQHKSEVISLAFAPLGSTLITASREDGCVYLWDLSTYKATAIQKGHSLPISAIALSPDGTKLATSYSYLSREFTVWNLKDGSIWHTYTNHTSGVLGLAYSPDGSLLATASMDKSTMVLDTTNNTFPLTLQAQSNYDRSVAFSPDGSMIATGGWDNPGLVNLWQVSDGKLLKNLPGQNGGVTSVVFSPDGKFLASGSTDNLILVWNVPSGQPAYSFNAEIERVNGLTYSPDGSLLAAASRQVVLYDMKSGKYSISLAGTSAFYSSVAFSPDGQILAAGGTNGNIDLWRVSDWSLIATLTGHHNTDDWIGFNGVAFTQDGSLLVSAGEDATVQIWGIAK